MNKQQKRQELRLARKAYKNAQHRVRAAGENYRFAEARLLQAEKAVAPKELS
jgi:hypothetical protein